MHCRHEAWHSLCPILYAPFLFCSHPLSPFHPFSPRNVWTARRSGTEDAARLARESIDRSPGGARVSLDLAGTLGSRVLRLLLMGCISVKRSSSSASILGISVPSSTSRPPSGPLINENTGCTSTVRARGSSVLVLYSYSYSTGRLFFLFPFSYFHPRWYPCLYLRTVLVL